MISVGEPLSIFSELSTIKKSEFKGREESETQQFTVRVE